MHAKYLGYGGHGLSKCRLRGGGAGEVLRQVPHSTPQICMEKEQKVLANKRKKLSQ